MERFGYVRAGSIPEAVTLLNEVGITSRPLAGGTDLVLLTRQEKICDRVVDISLIPEMHWIETQAGRVTVGAAATFSEIIESPAVQETAPVLVQACQQIGAVQIRNMGTLGGNVVNAAACADTLPALVCLDTIAHVMNARSESEWLVSELVLGPNRTVLPAGGLLVSLSYPIPPPGSRSVFLKLGRRNALAISRLTVAALGRLDETGRISEVRLVPGSTTPQITRFTTVEDSLIGQFPSQELCVEAGRMAAGEMRRITGVRWSSEFKEPVLQTMAARALMRVFGLIPEANGRAA
jgi:CO/xanthine dehydrogenase FAD-binding subunit